MFVIIQFPVAETYRKLNIHWAGVAGVVAKIATPPPVPLNEAGQVRARAAGPLLAISKTSSSPSFMPVGVLTVNAPASAVRR